MSRSNYSDDLDQWDLIRWRGAVKSAIRGGRGQALLRDMADALDAMPNKTLVANELQSENGEVCALGAVGLKRGVDMKGVDPENESRVAKLFDIAPALAQEVAYINDEAWGYSMTPERRWQAVRTWVAENLAPTTSEKPSVESQAETESAP